MSDRRTGYDPVDGPLATTIVRLERRLHRSEAEARKLEDLIEDRTRSLYRVQEQLENSKRHLENVLASMHSAVLITDRNGRITSVGGRTVQLVGCPAPELLGRPVASILRLPIPPIDASTITDLWDHSHEGDLLCDGGLAIPVLVAVSALDDPNGSPAGAIFVATDISERRQLELELRHAQRLESIGGLAAGVAHEINTPIQFVSDGVRFIGSAVDDLLGLLAEQRAVIDRLAPGSAAGDRRLVARLAAREEAIELAFLREELPPAVERTLDGLDRVARIVQALKQSSHPGREELSAVDLDSIVENTVVVARNEYRYVAEIDLHLGGVGPILGHPGDLGQVFLNLVVNASHAIADSVAGTGERGRITITTREVEDGVVAEVTDTGGGIPTAIRDRIFEPFFTTKEPGRGSGQGLALVHNRVVNRHGGRIEIDVEDGVGTTFTIWLPRRASDLDDDLGSGTRP